jgi:hypothetical protein
LEAQMARNIFELLFLLRRFGCMVMMALALCMPATGWAAEIHFNDLYARGTDLSDKAKALNGQQVEIVGYMAPPLKAKASFFVLTKMPLAVCPFCDSEVDWPTDIIFVRAPGEIDASPFNAPIRVTGTFQTGFEKDPDTGFVSFIRLIDAQYQPM